MLICKNPPLSRRKRKRADEYLRKLHKRQYVKEQPWLYQRKTDDLTI